MATSESVADDVLRVLDEAGFVCVPKIATPQIAKAGRTYTKDPALAYAHMVLVASGGMRQHPYKNEAAE